MAGNGSQIIVVTDGLANVGLGNLEDPTRAAEARDFFSRIGQEAALRGSAISIIKLKGDVSDLETLSLATEASGGRPYEIDPRFPSMSGTIGDIIQSVLLDRVVGTNAFLTVHLQRGLQFRHMLDASILTNDKATLNKELNTITLRQRVHSTTLLHGFDDEFRNFSSTRAQVMMCGVKLGLMAVAFVVCSSSQSSGLSQSTAMLTST
jgi:hypothetical protein